MAKKTTTPKASANNKDAVTLQRIETAHPSLRQELHEIYNEICLRLTGRVRCRFTHVLRTIKEQDDLFALGRTKPGKRVTNARGGQSFHNYGLAVDFCLLYDMDGNGTHETPSWNEKTDMDKDNQSDWLEVVAVFRMYGWEWGGTWVGFRDAPHFQKTFGYTTPQLKKMVDEGKVIKGTQYPAI